MINNPADADMKKRNTNKLSCALSGLKGKKQLLVVYDGHGHHRFQSNVMATLSYHSSLIKTCQPNLFQPVPPSPLSAGYMKQAFLCICTAKKDE